MLNVFCFAGIIANDPVYTIRDNGKPFVRGTLYIESGLNPRAYSPYIDFFATGDIAMKINEYVKKGDYVSGRGGLYIRRNMNKFGIKYNKPSIGVDYIHKIHSCNDKSKKQLENATENGEISETDSETKSETKINIIG